MWARACARSGWHGYGKQGVRVGGHVGQCGSSTGGGSGGGGGVREAGRASIGGGDGGTGKRGWGVGRRRVREVGGRIIGGGEGRGIQRGDGWVRVEWAMRAGCGQGRASIGGGHGDTGKGECGVARGYEVGAGWARGVLEISRPTGRELSVRGEASGRAVAERKMWAECKTGVAMWGGGADAGGGAGAGDVDVVVGRKKCGTGVEGAQTGAIGVGRDGMGGARQEGTAAAERARGVDAAARRDGTGVAARTRGHRGGNGGGSVSPERLAVREQYRNWKDGSAGGRRKQEVMPRHSHLIRVLKFLDGFFLRGVNRYRKNAVTVFETGIPLLHFCGNAFLDGFFFLKGKPLPHFCGNGFLDGGFFF
ncbi:hypothetical protein B0H14DRAFT_2578940 [Mycena olivaceomarginata]|nr:hypothetical protein B0H14DRAFT_2578940 [Mycena olivaceomarginata]